MSETLAVIITLGVTILIQVLKPEWLVGWLLDLINSKIKNKTNANKIMNNLAAKATDVAVTIYKKIPDDPVISEAVNNIEAENEKIKNELKNVL